MTMTSAFLKARYNALDFTKGHYIVGYYENGMVFACIMDNFHFVEMAHISKGSRNSGACLRYRQTKKAVNTLKAAASYIFQANRGKAFEKLVTEYFGQIWEDDHIPFWEDGDITLNGQAYQIKYDGCNFCNEKQLLGMGA